MWVNRSDRPWVPGEELSQGPTTGFGKNFVSALDDQMVTQSAHGAGFNFLEMDRKNLQKVKELTGDSDFYEMSPSEYYQAASEIEGKEAEWGMESRREVYESQKQRLLELKKQYPEIKTYDEVWAETKAFARQTEREFEDINARSTTWGKIGSLLGGMAGSFTVRDPLNLLTLGVGGVGKSIIARVGTEGVAQSAIEAVNQFTGVAKSREVMGLETSLKDQLVQIGFAGLGGAALRGTGEMAGLGAKKVMSSKTYKGLSERTQNVVNNILKGEGVDVGSEVKTRPVSNSDLIHAMDELSPDMTPAQRGAYERLKSHAEEIEMLKTPEALRAVDLVEQKMDDGIPVDGKAGRGETAIDEQLNKIENSVQDLLTSKDTGQKLSADEKIFVGEPSEHRAVVSGASMTEYRIMPGGEIKVEEFSYAPTPKGRKDAGALMDNLAEMSDRRGMSITVDSPKKTLRGPDGKAKRNPLRTFLEKRGFVETVDGNGKPTGTMVRQPSSVAQPTKPTSAPAKGGDTSAPDVQQTDMATPESVEASADFVKASRIEDAGEMTRELKARAGSKLSKEEAMLYADPVVDENGKLTLESKSPKDLLAEFEEDEKALKAMRECSL